MKIVSNILQVPDEPTCNCAITAIRKSTDRRGRLMYQRQCVKCGMPVGSYLSYRDVPARDSTEDWNQALQDRTWNAHNKWFVTNRQAIRQRWQDDYLAYLESTAWAEKRKAVLERDGHLCQICENAKATVVHHQTYEHLFDEPLEDLIGVCSDCHAKVHGRQV